MLGGGSSRSSGDEAVTGVSAHHPDRRDLSGLTRSPHRGLVVDAATQRALLETVLEMDALLLALTGLPFGAFG